MGAVTDLREFASYPIRPDLETPPPSTQAQMDGAIARLREGARIFAKLRLDQRIALARRMQYGYLRVAERTILAGCQAKGVAVGTPAEAEEWATGPWGVVRQLRLIRESLHGFNS